MKRMLLSVLNKPIPVTLVALVVAGAIGTFVWFNQDSGVDVPVQVAPADSSMSGSGTSTLTLAFITGGQIKSVAVVTGDTVHKGEVLATLDPQNTSGGLTQAKAAYDAAVAAYQKVVNGASGPDIDVAKAAVQAAMVARDQAVRQQQVLVDTAYTALLNVSPQAYPQDAQQDANKTAPVISGSYLLGKEGSIMVETYASGALSGYSFRVSGLAEGVGDVSNVTPQPIGNSGLYITFPQGVHSHTMWVIGLPNTKAGDYVAKYNAYQAALQAKQQAAANADAAVKQAQAHLSVVAASARPEDVATASAQVENARGALSIAQAAYDARRIVAPFDGTITAVHISVGQVALVSAPAIELSGSASGSTVTK